MERDHLFSTDKLKYVQGDRPDVDCILCAICEGNQDVKSLVLTESDLVVLSLNLYPYNPGHSMIFPRRHVTAIEELSDDEMLDMHNMLKRFIKAMNREFSPAGFNIGYNLGKNSGASIEHIHQHIVPRYPNEIGFLDVMNGTRVVVIDPLEVQQRIMRHL